MKKYRVTAQKTLDGNPIVGDVQANNEDHAWEVFCGTQKPYSVYNGLVEELPTRSELLARIQELETAGRKLVNSLPTYELDLARDVWGNTNVNVVEKYRDELAALLNNTEKE